MRSHVLMDLLPPPATEELNEKNYEDKMVLDTSDSEDNEIVSRNN